MGGLGSFQAPDVCPRVSSSLDALTIPCTVRYQALRWVWEMSTAVIHIHTGIRRHSAVYVFGCNRNRVKGTCTSMQRCYDAVIGWLGTPIILMT